MLSRCATAQLKSSCTRTCVDKGAIRLALIKHLPTTAIITTLGLAALLGTSPAHATTPQEAATVQHGINLVETGHCKEALPILKRETPLVTAKELRYHAEMATVRCAMAVDDEKTAADTLIALKREAPDDPEVLYIATHFFSELGMRSAHELQERAPNSYQFKRLQAESLESQGKNEEATAIYRDILKQHPNIPGIHYRLGQIALAEAGPNGNTDAAKAEFEKETQVDPTNASAEFILGELARRAGDWDDAARHFSRATKLDVGFSEAYLGLGMSLAASGKFAEAKAPLEIYVKQVPDDPAGHYQLAIADARTGDQAGAQREMALQRRAAALKSTTDNTQGHSVQP